MKVVLSPSARRDIDQTLEFTFQRFGERQFAIYADLISRAVSLLATEPARPSSKDRSNLYPGVRAIHLAVLAGGARNAAHVVYFRVAERGGEGRTLQVIRLLNQSMDLTALVEAGLLDLD